MSRISDEYLRWSMGQEKVSFRRDEAGKITKVIKRVDAALLPVYRALSKLQTPYLSPILSISEPDAGIIQVEESYIEGESLQEFLEAHGTLDEAEIQHCFLDIAQALKLLHSLQPPIIHRDIKPANIIKSKDGRYVLVDFDAAREYARKQDSDTHHTYARICLAGAVRVWAERPPKRYIYAGRYHVRNADRPAVSPGRFAVRRGTGADHCPLHRHVAKRPIPKRRGVD